MKDLSSANRHRKGQALEALTFFLMKLIDLKYISTRLRGEVTDWVEVDLIFENKRFIYRRWQILCKNAPTVSLDDIAKEVGLTYQSKSNVIIVVSTGSISMEAYKYADLVRAIKPLQIVLLNVNDLKDIAKKPFIFRGKIASQAPCAFILKKL